jgi:hypothetical protein
MTEKKSPRILRVLLFVNKSKPEASELAGKIEEELGSVCSDLRGNQEEVGQLRRCGS